MKFILTLATLTTLSIFMSCQQPREKRSKTTESAGQKREKSILKDSLNQMRRDSIEVAQAKHVAYLNRAWKTRTFIDTFGDPTNEKYIKTEIDGVFSNSATEGSYLFVEVILKQNAAGIFLHEYEKNRPAERFIGSAQIQMKNSLGEKIVINTSKKWSQQGGILIENWPSIEQSDFSTFLNFIKKSVGKIKVVVFDDYSSVYQFEIDATGFSEEYSGL